MHFDLPHRRDLIVGTLLKFLSETYGADSDVDMIPLCGQNVAARGETNHVEQGLVLADVCAEWRHLKSDSVCFVFLNDGRLVWQEFLSFVKEYL